MFQRLIDDFKDSTGTALRLTSLAAAAAVALFVTTSFLCAAAFIFVLKKYGPVEACLTGAAIFFVVTLIAAVSYMVRKRQIEAACRAGREIARRTTCWPIPMLVAAGIQMVRAIGVKKLIPILAVGGLALGFLASRGQSSRRRSAGGVADHAVFHSSIPVERRDDRWEDPFDSYCSNGSQAHDTTYCRDLAARCARVLQIRSALRSEGAGKTGCALHPRSRVQDAQSKRTRAYRFSGNTPAFPAQWFYGLYRALPGDRLSCHRRSREALASQELDTSVGASGPHDFAVRNSRARLARCRVHRIPHPTFVTIAKRPSSRGADGASW